jgi:hypothetical protein
MPDATYGGSNRISPLNDDDLTGLRRRNALLSDWSSPYADGRSGGGFDSNLTQLSSDTPPPAPPPAAPTTDASQGGGTTSPAAPTTGGAPPPPSVSATMTPIMGQTQPQPSQPSWFSMFSPGQAGYNPANQPTTQGSPAKQPSWASLFGPGQAGFNPNSGV